MRGDGKLSENKDHLPCVALGLPLESYLHPLLITKIQSAGLLHVTIIYACSDEECPSEQGC